jgi:protocatechuate 3,4-dioxygenase beta subunit
MRIGKNFFVVSLIVMTAGHVWAQSTTFRVSGTVVDAETGEPVRGILVQGGHVDENGKTTWGYSLTRRADSPTFNASIRWDDGWRARIIAPGYKSQPILEEHPKQDVIRGMVLKLIRGATVKGRVVDWEGNPVDGACLFVVGARSINVYDGKAWKDFGTSSEDKTVARAVSDDQGRFTLTGIDDEFHRIAISAQTLDLWVVSAKRRDENDEWVIELPKPHCLTIEYDIPGGPDPASFMIQMANWEREDWKYVESSRTVEVANGRQLTLSNLAESGFVVSRLKSIRTKHRGQEVLCEQQRIQVGPEAGLAEYVRSGGSSISGTVVGFPTTEKLEEQIDEASVFVRSAAADADPRNHDFEQPTYDAFRCDRTGAFTTEQLAPGKYKIVAYAYSPPSPTEGFTSGIELPQLVGEALFTIEGPKPPEPLRVELKPLK